MRGLWIRILWRSIPVAIVLGLMGYVFAEVFLIMHQMNGGVADPANVSMRWRTPLTMAGAGLTILVILELLIHLVRRKPLPGATPTEVQKAIR